MRKMSFKVLATLPLIALVSFLFSGVAYATLVTSLPNGTLQTMPAVNYAGGGPYKFGNNIIWASSLSNGIFGWIGSYGFTGNGTWTGAPAFAGLNGIDNTMTFTFGNGPVQGVGGLFNYDPNLNTGNYFTFSALGSSGNVIESYQISFVSGGTNTGETYYIEQPTADIYAIELSGGIVAIRNLQTETSSTAPTTGLTSSAVPAPPVFVLLLGALALLMARKKAVPMKNR